MTDLPEPTLPDGVAMTALGVAWVRATESERADRLFDDPLAARFVEASGWAPPAIDEEVPDPAGRAMLVLAQSVVVRTRFLDDVLAGAWAGGCRQVVILGAGLDTRAFRLPWPAGSRCFELDLPPVLAFKDRVLQAGGAKPRCERIPLAADLLADWPTELLAAGFTRAIPTVWLAEGLMIYFTQAENDRLMAEVGALSTVGDRLGITFSRAHAPIDPAAPPAAGETGAASEAPPAGPGLLDDPAAVIRLWRWAPPSDLVAWLAGHGWAAETFDREERAAAYGRPLQWATREDAATRTVLVDAHRL